MVIEGKVCRGNTNHNIKFLWAQDVFMSLEENTIVTGDPIYLRYQVSSEFSYFLNSLIFSGFHHWVSSLSTCIPPSLFTLESSDLYEFILKCSCN